MVESNEEALKRVCRGMYCLAYLWILWSIPWHCSEPTHLNKRGPFLISIQSCPDCIHRVIKKTSTNYQVQTLFCGKCIAQFISHFVISEENCGQIFEIVKIVKSYIHEILLNLMEKYIVYIWFMFGRITLTIAKFSKLWKLLNHGKLYIYLCVSSWRLWRSNLDNSHKILKKCYS